MAANEGQAFCLRWNNHKSNLVEVLDALIQKECYVDCTIVVEGQIQFKAHRVVLAANSPYFQSILQDVPMDHCSILFPGVQPFEMRALLDYMYTGEVNVTQSQIPKIMKIAEQLEVKGLFDMTDLKEKFSKFDETTTSLSSYHHHHSHHSHYPSSTHYPITHSFSNSSIYSPSSYDRETENLRGRVVGGSGNKTHNRDITTSNTQSNNNTNNENSSNGNEHQSSSSSSSMISTSTINITPAHSSSSPPYTTYKPPYTNLHSKSPGPSTSDSIRHSSSSSSVASAAAAVAAATAAQWPISAHLPTSLLSSVYESGSDMNPLKRKKIHSISSMLMSKDTPILRNVLQPHPSVDSSQAVSPTSGQTVKLERSSEKQGSGTCNGRGDYLTDKKLKYEEQHSPFTDKSFEDEGLDCPPNYSSESQLSNYSSQQQQKPEWKRYKQYTRSDILSAIECVRNGMSALQASRKFGVPSRTLYDKVKKLGIKATHPTGRALKRSPSNGGNSGNYSFGIGGSNHSYNSNQNESTLSQIHESQSLINDRNEKDREHQSPHLASTIPHPAAALLDPSFLQQALEGRGGDIAGREALHAMALVAAAHSAVNGMSTSPGANGSARSPSPAIPLKYLRSQSPIPPTHMKREIVDYHRDIEDDEGRAEDLSVGRKENIDSPPNSRPSSQQSIIQSTVPLITNHKHSYKLSRRRSKTRSRSESPSSRSRSPERSTPTPTQQQHHQQTGVIVPPITKLSSNGADGYDSIEPKRECITEDSRD